MASIAITDLLDVERLPVDAQDIVTRVRLVIAGSPAGTFEPAASAAGVREAAGEPMEATTPFVLPITYEYEAPEHAAFGCSRSFSLPEGFNPFLPPDHELVPDPSVPSPSSIVNPESMRDGDPATYAEASTGLGAPTVDAVYQVTGGGSSNWCGYKLRYSWVTDGALDELFGRRTNVRHLWHVEPYDAVATRVQVRRSWWLEPTDDLDSPHDSYQIVLADPRGLPANRGGEVLSRWAIYSFHLTDLGPGAVRLYEFYPLILNQSLLEDVAKSNIRLPAASPQRITVRGYVAPDRSHTIVGWPGGDYTASVAQHQYDLGRTIIDFEQAGAPAGLPAEAIEAARERQTAINATVQSSSYSLKMGERQ